MWRYSYLLRGLYETPVLPHGAEGPDRARAEAIIEAARQSGRTLLTEPESKELLACYGIPTAPTLEAHSADEAVAKAEELGYPVVVKLLSHTITHKTDVGGVKLNLSSAAAVRNAWREIETSVREKAGAEHFLGVTVQPFVRAGGLRTDSRQHRRCAVRPGAAVRNRRPVGRSVPRPRAGAAAAEHARSLAA